ncbi:EAL domain-containing protein [Methylobacterium aquaticum]|uniref:EAL domain-containing protein n=1 Tax=Methylobacterium aquaticum TaxID=270351 RepID=UPI00069F3F04|nr:EAL domain-containing protein [Methylobacterium aquaticum]
MNHMLDREGERLEPLHRLAAVGTEPEAQFDAICRVLRRVFDAPIALVSLVEHDRVWFKAQCGLEVENAPRDVAVCAHTILSDDVLVVEDLTRDARFRDDPLVTRETGFRAYAGVPLVLAPGLRVGALCVIDTQARTFSQEQIDQLRDLGEVVVAQLRDYETRRARTSVEHDNAEIVSVLNATLENMDQGLMMVDEFDVIRVCNGRAMAMLDLPAEMMRAQPTFAQVRQYQLDQNEFRRSPDLMRQWVANSGLEQRHHVYERERSNGQILEIRTVPLTRGGAVRTYSDVTERRRAEQQVTASEARYRALADGLPQMVWIIRACDGELLYRNVRFTEYYGEIGTSRAARVARNHPADAERVATEWAQCIAEGCSFDVEVRLRRHDGVYRWHKLVSLPVRKGDEIVEFLATALDIEDIVCAREALRVTTDRLRLAQEAAGVGLFEWNLLDGSTLLSPEALRLFNFPEDRTTPVTRAEWSAAIHHDDLAILAVETERAIATGETFRIEYRIPLPDGSDRWIMSMGRVSVDQGWRAVRMIGISIDVTERKQAEARIAHMARHDGLTDLPNRALFRERVEQRLGEIRRHRGHCVLMLLDLDAFKAVNDSLGHLAGDALLCEVARRFRATLRIEDTVARFGGDEFAILLGGALRLEGVKSLAERLIEVVRQPIWLDGQQVGIGVSIGIAIGPEHGQDTESLLRHADLALYRAKNDGRNTHRFFEPAMNRAVEERRLLELDLRTALCRGEFEMYYQPIVDLTSNEVVAVEALVRWRHPTRGLLDPGVFMPLAEETGLIVPLGEWVLRTATRDAQDLPEDLRVAINVSPAQVRHASFGATVRASTAAATLSPDRLELEISESALLNDHTLVQDNLIDLREFGVHLTLDDFGTGYSSLSYLYRYPFDRIKIDCSFFATADNKGALAILRTIVSLGHSLGMMVTADGVETPEQLAIVRRKGCKQAQGHLFGKARLFSEIVTDTNFRVGIEEDML